MFQIDVNDHLCEVHPSGAAAAVVVGSSVGNGGRLLRKQSTHDDIV